MIAIKSGRDLKAMREACVISARALKLAGEAVEPGVTTGEIDRRIRKYIESTGAKPSFLGYGGFPASACISVNNEVIHGIPGKRVIHAGDVVSVDVGAFFNGYHGDNAATFPCGDISPEAKALLDATRESLYEGIRAAMAGNRQGRRYWRRRSTVCRGAWLLGGTAVRRPRSRHEPARGSQRT